MPMRQKILIMQTKGDSLRSQAYGWDYEDSALYKIDKPVGFTVMPKIESYDNPLHAMAKGWQLLSPPQREVFKEEDAETHVYWIWYFSMMG